MQFRRTKNAVKQKPLVSVFTAFSVQFFHRWPMVLRLRNVQSKCKICMGKRPQNRYE